MRRFPISAERVDFKACRAIATPPKSAKFSVTMGQMVLAGYTTKDNWQKLPKQMLRARCLSEAVRAYFPEVLMGIYTDLEMADATDMNYKTRVTEDGDIEIIQDAEEVND